MAELNESISITHISVPRQCACTARGRRFGFGLTHENCSARVTDELILGKSERSTFFAL